MTTTVEQTGLAQEIRGLLAGVRRRIRAFVLAEGIALLLLWVGVTFWLGLAIDYFPILVWASELPWAARAVGLAAISAVAVWIIYQYILRRLFARLPDRSMAILLERRFGDFHDGLVTAVEMQGRSEGADPDMLAASASQAASQADGIDVNRVFNVPPLVWKWVGCIVLLAPVAVFGNMAPDALKVWVDRMYLLKETPWPRSARIEMVGVETIRPPSAWTEVLPSKPIKFKDHVVKVAKGADLKLRVQADTAATVIPDYCVIYYRAEDAGRGSVNMQRSGPSRQERQQYAFEGKPLRGVLTDLQMDIVGFDHRLRNYRIEVVDGPAIVGTTLQCEFPSYLQDEETATWAPREIEYRSSGVKLPKGTQVRIHCQSNKPLQGAYAVRLETGESLPTELLAPTEFVVPVVMDKDAVTLEIMLYDSDDIVTEQPLKIALQTIHDQPPEVVVRLQGIGSAVTPDVVTPIKGEITDDFLVSRAWFNASRGEDSKQYPIKIGGQGVVDDRLDFRLLRSDEDGMRLAPGDKLRLAVQASDRYDLDGADPNLGASDAVVLDVVTPAELLAILERRELGLRNRFEQIIEESEQLRDAMLLIRSGYNKKTGPDSKAGRDPSDPDVQHSPDELLERRRVRTRHGISQSQKLAQELLGVSVSFRDIRLELVNNRVDSEDRKQRIEDQIEKPMLNIAETMYPDLDTILKRLEADFKKSESSKIADEAIAQSNQILVELAKVLDAMADIESFNELMELVRGMIQEQEDLIRKTDAKRKADFFD